MTTATAPLTGLPSRARSWLGRAEDWLDARGKGAWIAAMILAFIFVWPLGLGLLAYMIWSKRMFGPCQHRRSRMSGFDRRFDRFGRSSGNTAFDAYKADTLERLEREQDEFESFLRRLRESKDKAEFDQYMDERARARSREAAEGPAPEAPGAAG